MKLHSFEQKKIAGCGEGLYLRQVKVWATMAARMITSSRSAIARVANY